MTDQAENTSLELQRSAAGSEEKAMLGHLATTEHYPELRSDTAWERPETGLQAELATVHLGIRPSNGLANPIVDQYITPVPEAGIGFGVYQAPHGTTSIFAKPLEGYRVEAADFDQTTGMVSWKPTGEDSEVKVTWDRGNMAPTPAQEAWNGANMGNPGTRAGIVRVTGPDQEVKFFVMGADFQGTHDNWDVTGGIIEVQPSVTQELSGSQAQLPPSSAK